MDDATDDLDWDSGCWDIIRAQSDYIEFDWFARDVAGHVAALSSFGIGPSPSVVRESREQFNLVLRLLEALPETTRAVVDPSPPPRPDDWEHYARCGLFGYDNAHIDGRDPRYKRIACPVVPLRFEDLAVPQDLVARIPILPVVFRDSPSISFADVPA